MYSIAKTPSWRRTVKQTATVLFSLWFACINTVVTVANAQVANSDFEAPIIEHEEINTGVLGDIESFVATVVDNEELKSVSLFYRYTGQSDFTEISMKPLAASSYYTATVDTSKSDGDETAIEYYIRAEDTSGNLVLKGFAFEPLVRSLASPSPFSASTETTTTQPTNSAPKKKINWLYVALGVLVLGGIAGAAGGGSDDDDDGPVAGECNPNCQVTLTISPP